MNNQGEIIGLAHIGVHTADLDKSIAFYRDILEFKLDHVAEVSDGAVKLAFLAKGSCVIELIQIGDGSDLTSRGTGVIDHVALGVKDIANLVERLEEKGVTYETQAPSHVALKNGARNIFFHGPSGERLEFFEYL